MDSKIYTKTGDKGMTSLVGGHRVSKTHPRIEAYGTIDELNSFIGLLITEIDDVGLRKLLQYIQNQLFSVSAYLATDPTKTEEYRTKCRITEEDVQRLEDAIDAISKNLPKIKYFILPGGCHSAALAHVCRTICRRAERQIYLIEENAELGDNVLAFINRLSDLLFVMARNECVLKNGEEILWNNNCK